MASTMQVGDQMKDAIQAAADDLYSETAGLPGGPFKLAGGGFRSLDVQVDKWVRQCEGKPACGIPVCNPFPAEQVDPTTHTRRAGAQPDQRECSHTSGQAVDVYCAGGTTNQFFAPCQIKLEEIMQRHGFCRLESEPWHFEQPKFSTTCGSYRGTATRHQTNQTWNYASCTGTFNMKTGTCSQ